jgi:hypothetical protein
MSTMTSTERARATALAVELRARGYEVDLAPVPEQLPEFLASFHPDLVAHRGDEHLVVEVKSRRSLVGNPSVREIARVIQGQANWTFELVIVRDDEDDPMAGVPPLEREDILRELEEAEKLSGMGHTRAALLLAWASSEAAIRWLGKQEGIEFRSASPLRLLNSAVGEGFIGRDDYEFMTKAMQHRNAIAHGFRSDELDPNFVQDLVRLTKSVLEQPVPSPA